MRRGSKLLLVVDQFEQWLHAPAGARGDGLVAALRQCDGLAAQALLLVRDDFGMAAMRFMNAIEVPVTNCRYPAPVLYKLSVPPLLTLIVPGLVVRTDVGELVMARVAPLMTVLVPPLTVQAAFGPTMSNVPLLTVVPPV